MTRLSSTIAICICILGYINAESPVIIPKKSFLYMLEGSELKLDCRLETKAADSPLFYKMDPNDESAPGTLIEDGNSDGFIITGSGSVQGDKTIKTVTITKQNVTFRDRGQYRCKKSSSNDDTRINIVVFRVKVTGAILNETVPMPIDLKCEQEGLSAGTVYEISWSHKDVVLANGDKYSIFKENGTLNINNPERADMGAYFCTFVFTTDQTNVTAKEVELKAAPKIDSSDNNKSMVQGDPLVLKCKASGYPQPTMHWLKDGKPINHTASTRIHTLEHEGSENGKLQIYNLEYEDEGVYTCVATSEAVFDNSSADIKVSVKDKLAALWPFLGIVAEVIILCVIILVYEKKRSKQMSDDDDAVDGAEEKATDNKNVRRRN